MDDDDTLYDQIVEVIESAKSDDPAEDNDTYTQRIVDLLPIQPGDLVEPTDRDLDPRAVKSTVFDQVTGAFLLTLDIFGHETTRLPADRYRVVKRRGAW
jgi:hypothetical protein